MLGLSPIPPRPSMSVEINPEIPAYKVMEKRGFFDDFDHLWPQGSMVYWDGEPNPGFEPLNDIAEERLREYFMGLDKKATEVAEKKGVGHASLVNAFDARQRLKEMDNKVGNSVDIEEEMPVLRAKKHGKRKAHSIHDMRMVPMLGHQGRHTAAKRQAQGKNAED